MFPSKKIRSLVTFGFVSVAQVAAAQQPPKAPACDPANLSDADKLAICAKQEEPKPTPPTLPPVCGEGTVKTVKGCECVDGHVDKVEYWEIGRRIVKCLATDKTVHEILAAIADLQALKADKDSVYTRTEIDVMILKLEGDLASIQRGQAVTIVIVNDLRRRTEQNEADIRDLKGSRVSLFAGLGGEFDLKGQDPGAAGHATFLVEGGPGGRVGMYGLGQLGIGGTRDARAQFEAGASIGVSIALDALEQYKLLLGPEVQGFWRERDSADDNGADGLGLGWQVGFEARFLLQPVSWFALSPYAAVGGGRFSGWRTIDGVPSTPYMEAGPAVNVGFDFLFGGEVTSSSAAPTAPVALPPAQPDPPPAVIVAPPPAPVAPLTPPQRTVPDSPI